MSNQFLKLRRSSVPGKMPDTSSLDFGEIALNTYDGLAFMKKSGSNGEEIVVLGSTSGSFTGSLFGTASWSENSISSSYSLTSSYSFTTISSSYVSGSSAIITNLTSSTDASINGLTIGKGKNSIVSNTAIGGFTLPLVTTGNNNTAVGYQASNRNSSGANNASFGSSALFFNTSGTGNTAIGMNSMLSNTIGQSNTAVGLQSLYSNSSGQFNTALGSNALYSNSTGQQNIALGTNAGYGTGTNANTSGTNNIFVGYQSVGISSTESNRTWIGNSSTIATWLGGNLLLGGTSNDTVNKLQVYGSGRITSGLSVSGSTQITGSLGVTGSVSISGSIGSVFTANVDTLLFTGSIITNGSIDVFGNLTVQGGGVTSSFSGSYVGDGYGLFNIPASGIVGLNLSRIATGSITASVDVNPSNAFLIKSGSTNFINITNLGETTVWSSLFIIKNPVSNNPVLTVSESVVKIATQSFDPTGTTDAGSIWFTNTAMYVGLE